MGATTGRVHFGEKNEVECRIRRSETHDRVVTVVRSGRTFEFAVNDDIAEPLDACPEWVEGPLYALGIKDIRW